MDAVVTGDLAGYNAVRKGLGQSCLELPNTLIVGAYIDYVRQQVMKSEDGLLKKGYVLLDPEILKDLKVYREDESEIVEEVKKVGLIGIYKAKLC